MNNLTKTLKVEAEVEVPIVPNYLRLKNGSVLAVGDVTDEALEEISRAWAEALLKRAAKQRKEKK